MTIEINIGEKFGKLSVVQKYNAKSKHIKWICKCDCGNKLIARSSCLKGGKVKSCGCLRKQKSADRIKKIATKHNLSKHPLYSVWHDMKQRCNNKNHNKYKYYGKRGIKVCNEWMNDPEKFIKWGIENGYKTGLEIDRINNNNNYNPNNCKFSNRHEQLCNRRSYGTTQIKYVYKNGNGYIVRKSINGKQLNFGTFKILKEAETVAKGKPWLKLQHKN